MAGKIPNIIPSTTTLRLKGVLSVYWSPKFQRLIARRWPSGNYKKTARRVASNEAFIAAVKLIKQATTNDLIQAESDTANTPWLVRDFLMMAAYGNLIVAQDNTGTAWYGRRILLTEIQSLLDSISATVGSVLIRTNIGWQGINPPSSTSVLSFNPANGIPAWMTPYLVTSDWLDQIDNVEGDILVRGSTGWIALPKGADNDVLTMDPATHLPTWLAGGGGGATGFAPGNSNFIDAHTGTAYGQGYWQGTTVFVQAGTTISSIKCFAISAAAPAALQPALYDQSTATLTTLLASGPKVTGIIQGVNSFPLTIPWVAPADTMVAIGCVQTANVIILANTQATNQPYFATADAPPNPAPATSYANAPHAAFWAG